MKPTSGRRIITVRIESGQRTVVDDARQKDVLCSAGTCRNEDSDSRRDDGLDDVFERLPLQEADQRQQQRGTNRSADRRIELPACDPGNGKGDEGQR